MSDLTFNPGPSATQKVFDDLADPALSPLDVARRHGTSLDALTLWLEQPGVRERFASIESFAARRVRLVASCNLSASVRTAVNILNRFNSAVEQGRLDDLVQQPVAPAPSSTPPADPRLSAFALRLRAVESARKTASLLARLAHFHHGPPRAREPAAHRHEAAHSAPETPTTSYAARADQAPAIPRETAPATRAMSAPEKPISPNRAKPAPASHDTKHLHPPRELETIALPAATLVSLPFADQVNPLPTPTARHGAARSPASLLAVAGGARGP